MAVYLLVFMGVWRRSAVWVLWQRASVFRGLIVRAIGLFVDPQPRGAIVSLATRICR